MNNRWGIAVFCGWASIALAGRGLQAPDTSPLRDAPNSGTSAPLPHESHATRTDSSAASGDATSSDPTAFVKSAAMGQLTQVALAKLAISRSKDAAIRNFAGRVIKDYGSANAELTGIAKPKGLDVPTLLDGEDQNLVREGARKEASEFDRWYVARMLTEQDKAVVLYQDGLNCTDLDFAGFAKKTLPVLIEDQKMASVLPMAVNH